MYKVQFVEYFMDSPITESIVSASLTVSTELYDAVLFDCDGVLYQSSTVLPGAIETVAQLHEENIQVKFVTNSSTKSRHQLFSKLTKLGFTHIEMKDCFPTSFATASFLHNRGIKKVYVIGEQGLVDELQAVGIVVFGGPCDSGKTMSDSAFIEVGNSSTDFSDIDAVVVGYDQCFNYYKLAIACMCFQKNDSCVLIATNDDRHDRIGSKWLIPVNGCALAAVVHAVNCLDNHRNVQPIVIGKPNRVFGDLVLSSFTAIESVDRNRVLMIGDKIETDIAFGNNCGFQTCLVLTGCVTAIEPNSKPADHVLSDLTCLNVRSSIRH